MAVCVGKERGEGKKACRAATQKQDIGVVGDIHSGSSHRGVSLLARESISALQQTSWAKSFTSSTQRKRLRAVRYCILARRGGIL